MTRWLVAGIFGMACASVSVPPDTAIIPSEPDSAFECAMREVNALGYTVRDADRAAWFIRAESPPPGLGAVINDLLMGVDSYDELTLTVYPLEDGRHVLRVVTHGYEVTRHGEESGGRIDGAPSKQALRDARRILEHCGAAPDST